MCECGDLGNASPGLLAPGGINNTPEERGHADWKPGTAVAVTLVEGVQQERLQHLDSQAPLASWLCFTTAAFTAAVTNGGRGSYM